MEGQSFVDVSMTSGPDTFGSVEPVANYNFPSADSASTGSTAISAQTALVVGALGVVIGILGLITGLLAMRAARRRSV